MLFWGVQHLPLTMINNNGSEPVTKINQVDRLLISELQIQQRVSQLARKIAQDLNNRDLVMIPLLKGAFVFAADLLRRLNRNDIKTEVDFIRASSYGQNDVSTGEVRLTGELSVDVTDKFVLVVDDIIDTGKTLQVVHNELKFRGAEVVRTCVLLDKPSRRLTDFSPDYVGFQIPDIFVVGYGMDYAEKWRHLPCIMTY